MLALVHETYAGLSTAGSDVARLFEDPVIAVAGSGQGELASGPEVATQMATAVASLGYTWNAETVTVWRRGDVAWAQILGSVHVTRDGRDERVPYWTTGVFGRDGGRWRWLYWGGAEPQESPRV